MRPSGGTKAFFVIAYDVVSDRRRNRIADCLDAYGARVQDSVYEVRLSPAQRVTLARKLTKELDPKEDSIRWYALCAVCVQGIERQGVGPGVYVIEPVLVI